MTPERWQRIKSLFEAALDLPPQDRPAFVREACLDASLREEVICLLSHHEDSSDRLDKPFVRLDDCFREPPSLVQGAELARRFRIERLLGRGGMGEVYRAFDLELREKVALKALHPSIASDPRSIERFKREIQLARRVTHPNVCRIHDLVAHDGPQRRLWFLTMELIEGETLGERLEKKGPIAPAEALALLDQMAAGLDSAHRQGVIHRDFKPSNVMLTRNREGGWRAAVTDFGLARLLSDQDLSTLSATGQGFGTLRYMSPEQLRGLPAVPASDIYALGLVIFEMLTGHPPDHRESPLSSALERLQGSVPPLESLPADTDSTWERAVKRCLQPDPSQRPHSAQEALALLHPERPTTPRPKRFPPATLPRRPGSLSAWLRRKTPVLLTASILALGALAVAALWRPKDEGRAASPAAGRLTAVVTWSSDEKNSRISPDQRWISFVSNRDEKERVFLAGSKGESPVPIAGPEGKILDTLWSPESDRIAILVRQSDQTYLQIIPAFFGGVVQFSHAVKAVGNPRRLVRWEGTNVYLEFAPRREGPGWLGRVDVLTGALTPQVFAAAPFDNAGGFDLSHHGNRVLFAGLRGERTDIWTCGLDGTDLRRITDDENFESQPRWLGSSQEAVAFVSNRSGHNDIWAADLESGLFRRLTSDTSVEWLEDTASDGSFVTFQTVDEKSDLWRLDALSGEQARLTADSLPDFWPSLSAESRLLVFQRNPSSLPGFLRDSAFYGRILLVEGPDFLHQLPTTLAEPGFAPRLSPDGKWIAYLRRLPDSGSRPGMLQGRVQLRVHHLASRQDRELSNDYQLEYCDPFPLNWTSSNMAWGADGSLLFAALSPQGLSQITQCPLTGGPCRVVVEVSDSEMRLEDLYPAPDSRRLAYLRRSLTGDASWSLHVADLASGLQREVLAGTGDISLKGWIGEDEWVLLRTSPGLSPVSADVLRVGLDSPPEVIGTVRNVYRQGSSFDPASGNLYLILQRGKTQELAAFSLATRRLRMPTSSQDFNAGISGLNASAAESIVYARHSRSRDIWMVRLGLPEGSSM